MIEFPRRRPARPDGVRLPAEPAGEVRNRLDQVAAIVRAETGCTAERADFVAARVVELIRLDGVAKL